MATASGSPPPRITLAVPIEQRGLSSALDSKIVNGYVEKDLDGETWVNKRPSMVGAVDVAAGAGRGIYRWLGALYTIIVTAGVGTLYKNGVALGVVTDATNRYWFNETLGTPSWLYLSNGVNAYTVSSAGVFAAIIDANYIAIGNTVPGSTFLDGTLYVMDSQARIWGTTGLNNPNVWSALNLIQAQVEPDKGVALAKQNIYVIAIKQWTTEVFYDAGNATGSPLSAVLNAIQPYGCAEGNSVQRIDDILYWISTNRTGGLRVVRMDKLQCTIISNFAVDRLLSASLGSNAAYLALGFSARINGHSFYGIQFIRTGPPQGLKFSLLTLLYDIDEKNWYTWNSGGAAALPLLDGTGSQGLFLQNNVTYQNFGDATLFVFQDDLFTGDTFDGGVTKVGYTLDIVTANFNGGTKLVKTLNKLRTHADQYSAGTLRLRYSDDDYKTWSNWQDVNLQDENPMWTNLGSFRKRAFQLRHEGGTPLRISHLEPELFLGPA